MKRLQKEQATKGGQQIAGKKMKRSQEGFGRGGGDSDDSNEEEDDDDDDDDNDDDDDDDEGADDADSLPRALFLYANQILQDASSSLKVDAMAHIGKANSALVKGRTIMLALHPDLQSLYDKYQKRKQKKGDDGKVAPGSGLVSRHLNDDRYLLCLICINQSKVYDMQNRPHQDVIEALKEALLWFPKSCEANYLLAKYTRPLADTQEALSKVEMLLQKASNSFSQLMKSLTSGKAMVSKMEEEEEAQTEDGGHLYDEIKETNMLLQWELSACESAQQLLALMLCQTGKTEEAGKLLEGQGFKWRLSKQVFCYEDDNGNKDSSQSETSAVGGSTSSSISNSDEVSKRYLVAIDDALPKDMLDHLKDVFSSSSPFWSEHHYDVHSNYSRVAGYFSYLYPLRERKASNSIEQIIDRIYSITAQQFPEVEKECLVAEWWVHTRPHSSGHQLHFDSDETRLEGGGGKPQHPIASTILFVNGSDVGGPTLVTNQVLNGKIADKGWLAYPKEGRLVTFDANYLHGVIPGKGVVHDPSKRRLTFMVGFWKSIAAKPRGNNVPGPGQPLPDLETTSYTWPKQMSLVPHWSDDKHFHNASSSSSKIVQPTPISCVWEPIDGKLSAKDCRYEDFFQGF